MRALFQLLTIWIIFCLSKVENCKENKNTIQTHLHQDYKHTRCARITHSFSDRKPNQAAFQPHLSIVGAVSCQNSHNHLATSLNSIVRFGPYQNFLNCVSLFYILLMHFLFLSLVFNFAIFFKQKQIQNIRYYT